MEESGNDDIVQLRMFRAIAMGVAMLLDPHAFEGTYGAEEKQRVLEDIRSGVAAIDRMIAEEGAH